MKKTLLLFSVAAISGCTMYGEAETRALKNGAIADAKNASQEEIEGYLQCYALPDSDKDSCRRRTNRSSARQSASTWEYIRPYDAEIERQAFMHFLRKNNKKCHGIKKLPAFNKEKRAYQVTCNKGNAYQMSFDRENKIWRLK